MRLTKAEKDREKDLANPRERRWLDRLIRMRPDMSGVFVDSRESDGSFRWLKKRLRRRLHGSAHGVYPADLCWVKREVVRLEQQRRRESIMEVEQYEGAYI